MTRRLALISDVHGNLPALEAVLSDIESTHLTEVYCLGDLVGYGPDPAGVVSHVRHAGIPCIRGNYDDGIGWRRGKCGCLYDSEQAKRDGDASYAFTDRVISDEDRAWLASLPEQRRLEVDGLRVLLAHGSPRKLNEYLTPDRPDVQLARLAENAEADVVCVGHVHVPYHRSLTGTNGERIDYVNAGSIGKPKDGDARACWVELALGGDVRAESEVHRVGYDVEAVAEAMLEAGLPATLAEALRTA